MCHIILQVGKEMSKQVLKLLLMIPFETDCIDDYISDYETI